MYNFNTTQICLFPRLKTSKVFVRYHLEGQLKNSIRAYIDELYSVEDVLKESDNFVIVLTEPPNENTVQLIRNLYNQEGIFITLLLTFHI